MADVMILAAGLGTRMKSRRAKVLHLLAGKPLIAYAIRTALSSLPESLITVVGHDADNVEKAVRDEATRSREPETPLYFALQTERHGTGHAVMAATEFLKKIKGPLVIIAGDGPLLKGETLKALIEDHQLGKNAATMLTTIMEDPTGYGRIVRDDAGQFLKSVEQRDADPDELAIKEAAVSIYCFEVGPLMDALNELKDDNAQREYYLTDVPGILRTRGLRVGLHPHSDSSELAGVNSRIELAALEKLLRERKLKEAMLGGVTIIDPASTYIDQEVVIGQDTLLHPQVMVEGDSSIERGCVISSWTRLKNVVIEDEVQIRNSCVVEDSIIRRGASIGPFSRLRANAEIGEGAAIGNFVEVKKSKIGRKTKASHLSYLGDATLGDDVNIGAGTVTCNYDGVRKNETIIEDGVRIGSDTMLVAPVRVGRGAKTGAGAVVTKDVPPDSLAVGVPAVIKKKLQ